MPETLLSPSNVLIYGRVVADLQIVRAGNANPEEPVHRPFVAPRGGQNLFLQSQLEDPTSTLARIYGFGYEGYYYDLARPVLMLVHGLGEEPDRLPGQARVARGPDEVDRTGVGAQNYSFSSDMRVWSYDKGDFTIRMDVETGTFEEVLLEAELEFDDFSLSYSGAKVRGAKVRGAKVRGAKVRGAKVRGAKVRGDLDD